MRVAIIGAGISGLTCAYLLQAEHDVMVFEGSDHIGGHTLTIDVEQHGRTFAVDTGFVVYNEATYPNFVRLLDRLKVTSRPTNMSFSVRCDTTGLEYCGTSLNTLFAQRRNLLSLPFYRLLLDIVRFNRSASRSARHRSLPGVVGDYVRREQLSGRFNRHYLVPLIAAIWSLDPAKVADFPTEFFLRFMSRHKLLLVRDQLDWRVVAGGSREYVRKLTANLRNPVRTNTTIRSIARTDKGVEVQPCAGEGEIFDHVVLATHSDQSLSLLADPSPQEREILGAIEYQRNDAVLHTDTSLLPRQRRAWANWNYRTSNNGSDRPVTTYNMAGLQGLDVETPFCLTLNDAGSIAPEKVIRQVSYEHPVYNPRTVEAQQKRQRISGVRRTHYCGAYWGYGFHEDGVSSALAVCRDFGVSL